MDDPVAKPSVKSAKGVGRRAGSGASAPVLQPVPPKALRKPSATKPAPAKPVVAKPVVTRPAADTPAPAAPVSPPVSAPEPAPVALLPERVVSPPIVADPVEPILPTIAAPLAEAPAPVLHATQTAAKEVIMETIENVTAKTQTAFNDATERAKGAVEKGQKFFEDANEFGKGNIEALVESSKIAARGLEALGQDAAAYAKKSFEEATVAAKTLTSVKSPTEFLKLQSDYARSAFDAMVQQTSHNTEALLKLAGEVAQPLSNRVALAAEKLKVAA